LLKNPYIYEVMPIELFVDMKNLHKLVEVAHRTMLENLVFSECLYLNRPKGWKS
jgi:hypothetical protein